MSLVQNRSNDSPHEHTLMILSVIKEEGNLLTR